MTVELVRSWCFLSQKGERTETEQDTTLRDGITLDGYPTGEQLEICVHLHHSEKIEICKISRFSAGGVCVLCVLRMELVQRQPDLVLHHRDTGHRDETGIDPQPLKTVNKPFPKMSECYFNVASVTPSEHMFP